MRGKSDPHGASDTAQLEHFEGGHFVVKREIGGGGRRGSGEGGESEGAKNGGFSGREGGIWKEKSETKEKKRKRKKEKTHRLSLSSAPHSPQLPFRPPFQSCTTPPPLETPNTTPLHAE